MREAKRAKRMKSRPGTTRGSSLLLALLLLGGGLLEGQIMDNPVDVPVSIRATVLNGTGYQSSSIFPQFVAGLNGQVISKIGTELTTYPRNTDTLFTTLVLDREYDLQINSVYVGDVQIFFDLPPGFQLLIDGHRLLTHAYDGLNYPTEVEDTLTIVITASPGAGKAGEDLRPRTEGNILWGVSMGLLSNGASAGWIMIRESALTTAAYAPGILKYARPASDEIDVVRLFGDLRQIKTASVLADIVAVTDGFEIRFYKSGDFGETLSGSLYPINSGAQPFSQYALTDPDYQP